MEVQNYLPEPLNFETKSSINIEKQRKILQYYSKPENERPKKNKAQLFTMQNIMGLASVLDINTSKLQFICQQVLSTEFNIFMQTAKRFNLSVKQPLQIVQGTLIVLLDGCIIKKLENICNLSSLLLNNMMFTTPTTERGPSRNRSILIPGQNRKNITKSIETNPKQSPKLISHESSQPRPYECKTNVCYLQFSDLTLQKLQNWIQIKEKESLTNFISSFFPQIDDRKALLKLANKARRVFMYHKNQFSVQPNVAYLIFKGTILLKSDCYQIQLNNKSIICKSESSELKTTCISSTVLIISILLDQISQILEDSKQIMKAINYKLKNIHQERKKLFEKTNYVGDADELIEPVFSKEILNMRAFQRGSNKQNIIELKKIGKNKINKPKGFTATPLSSKRSKLGQQFSSSITLPSEMSIFLSNYPFIKIVQSEERARSIIKMSLGSKGLNKKQKPSQQQVSEEQKRKVEKQIKRIYYNDKVMRLKIRNIAQKQIPNGKKKNFDSGKAQKQISEYLLFKNIIEYPMDGQSENATKQALNQKIIAKFTKMSSLNCKSDNKTADNAYLRSKYDGQMQDYKCEDDSMISVNGSALDSNTTPKMEEKVTNIGSNNVSGMYDKNDSYSSYCNRVLYPHLKIHKSGKLKSPRMSNNKMQKQNNDFVKIIKLQQGQTVRNSSQMQTRRQNIFLNKLKKVCLTNGHRINTVS